MLAVNHFYVLWTKINHMNLRRSLAFHSYEFEVGENKNFASRIDIDVSVKPIRRGTYR